MQNIADGNDLDFSSDEIDGTLVALRQTNELIPVTLESLNVSALRASAEAAERQTQYWARQKNNVQSLLGRSSSASSTSSSSSSSEWKKLSSALVLCCENWMKWDGRYSSIQDELEKELDVTTAAAAEVNAGSSSDEGRTSITAFSVSDAESTVIIPVADATFNSSSTSSLKSSLKTFLAVPHYFPSLSDLQLSVIEGHLEDIREKGAPLLQSLDETMLGEKFVKMVGYEGVKFRKIVKRNWEDGAQLQCSEAERYSSQRRFDKAVTSYRLAIMAAEEAIHVWSEIEVFYIKLRAATGLKVRRLGVRIKETLKANVRAWQATLFEIESTKEENCKRVLEWSDRVQERRREILNIEKEVLAVEQDGNEVSNICNVAAARMTAVMRQLRSTHDAYSRYEFNLGEESERRAEAVQQEVDRLNQHVESRYCAWQEWNKRNIVSECLETDCNNRSVWKMRYMGPLVRKEKIAASGGQPEQHVEMAAEHLMVALQPSQSEDAFCDDLTARGFSGCRLEQVSKKQCLYRLCFLPKKNSWLQTMDDLRACIQECGLAVRCYRDIFLELDSASVAGASPSTPPEPWATPETLEPWAFFNEKGLLPPVGLFDEEYSYLTAPAAPLKVAIIDTGIVGSFTGEEFETHAALVGKIAMARDNEQQQVTGFGFNACDEVLAYMPNDNHGHGTHVAGIVAARHGVVNSVAGLAGMAGYVELVICKWLQPGIAVGLASHAIACIEYAERAGARVMNCSWGRRLRPDYSSPEESPGFTEREVQGLETSIRGKDFVVITSAGNSSEDVDRINRYPCNFVLGNLISVAATNKLGNVGRFSNFGTVHVHLAAPGKNIFSASHRGPQASCVMTGTSQAAPYVAAAAALTLIKFPFLSPPQLVAFLCAACKAPPRPEMQVKYGPLILRKVLSIDEIVCFLKAQHVPAGQIAKLLNA